MNEGMTSALDRRLKSLEIKADRLCSFNDYLRARHALDFEEILRLRAALRSIAKMDVHPSYDQAKIARDALECVTDA